MSEDKILKSKRCSIISLVMIAVRITLILVMGSIGKSVGTNQSVSGLLGMLWIVTFVAGLVTMIMAMVYNPRNPLAIVALVIYALGVLLFVIGLVYALYFMNMMASTLTHCGGMGALLFLI